MFVSPSPRPTVTVSRALGLTAFSVAGLLVSLALIDPSLRNETLSAAAPEVCAMSLDAPPLTGPSCQSR